MKRNFKHKRKQYSVAVYNSFLLLIFVNNAVHFRFDCSFWLAIWRKQILA